MKFTRRHDLDPQTRIEIVKHVWIHQGLYGKMTQIAQEYQISRTFLSQLSWAARHHLENLFSDPQPLIESPEFLLEPWILSLRLEGNCSIPSISSIFNTTLSDSKRAQFPELLRGDPPHHSLMTQPSRHLTVHRWQSTTPIGPRGKKGRVGDPVWPDRDGVVTPDTSENSWPASR